MSEKDRKKTPAASRRKRPIGNSRHSGADRVRKPNRKADRLWLYGRHCVAAALANPERRIYRLHATKNALDWLNASEAAIMGVSVEDAKPDAIDRLLPQGAVHQGLAAEVEDLPRARLKEVCAPAEPARPVLVLDQITDPQNIGALFRAAAAFGARAIIVQDRRTPPLSGALAKAAAGAIETIPCVKVVNIARSLEALADLGYQPLGLAGEGALAISQADKTKPVALILGAEGAGLRPGVAEKCDAMMRIPIESQMESLNVSTAAAVALYEVTRGRFA